MKKFLATLTTAFLLSTPLAWAEIKTDAVRTVSKPSGKIQVSMPQMVKGEASANGKINTALTQAVNSLLNTAKKDNGGKISYEIKKIDEKEVSFTLNLTKPDNSEFTKGLTFDRGTGATKGINNYFNAAELERRSAIGLKFLYDVPQDKSKEKPGDFYIDEDSNVIGIYHAGSVLDKSEGEIEINLTAADSEETTNPASSGGTGENNSVQVSSASGTGTVSGTDVRMRGGAGTNSEILGYFDNNESVTIKGTAMDGDVKWYQVVRSNGTEGWISGDYLNVEESTATETATSAQTPNKQTTGTITGVDVRMRAEAGLDGAVLGYFEKGETVTILDTKSVAGSDMIWAKVRRADGSEGWVAKMYCNED